MVDCIIRRSDLEHADKIKLIFQEHPQKTRKKTDSMNSLQTSVFVKDRLYLMVLAIYQGI